MTADLYVQPEPSPCACQKSARSSSGGIAPCPRRIEIAEAARKVIVEKGLEGLRTRDIAERAGINIATLHYHVPTKEALILAVADSVRAEFIAQDTAHPRDGMTPAQRLRQEIEDFQETLLKRQELLQLMSEFMERARRDPLIREIFGQMHAYWRRSVADILAAGVADGSFRSDIDPELGAAIFTGALISGARQSHRYEKGMTPYLNQLERLFLRP